MNIKKAKKGPWPKRTPLTLEEQKKILGIHWRGHENYQPTAAHLHPCGSFFMEQVRKKAHNEGRYGIY